MRAIPSAIRAAVRRLGFDVVRYPAPHPSDLRRELLLREAGVTLVLDVGAVNVGQFADGLRRHGYRGRIVSFEPLPGPFAELSRVAAADPGWTAVNVGLGDAERTAVINVAANTESSSLLAMDPRHLAAAPESAYVAHDIRVVPLDAAAADLVGPDDVVWLKIDVQGYEAAVLDGAASVLARVAGLELELSLVPLYDGQPLAEDLLRRLRAAGYEMVATEDVFVDPRTSHTLQVAGLFVRAGRADGPRRPAAGHDADGRRPS